MHRLPKVLDLYCQRIIRSWVFIRIVPMEQTGTVASDQNSDQKEKVPASVPDKYAAQIVFFCNINQACVIWQSIFDQQLKISPEISRKLGSLIERALSMMNGCDELRQILHLHCASSFGFLRMLACIAIDVLLGEFILNYDCGNFR